jgi:FlaA1/EpsC-like NDP-sugar epimerase
LSKVLKKHGYESVNDYTPGVEIIGIRPGEKIEEELEW